MIPTRWHWRRLAAAAFLGLAAASWPPCARAADFEKWGDLEQAEEFRNYRNLLREGTFADESKAFLTTTALPQLGLPKNRIAIDRVRRKMRETLCGEDAADRKAADAALGTVADFMIAVARDTKADAVLRVNATLLVGELRGQGGKPWPPAAAPLAAAMTDRTLPPAVRIAAAAGLARQVEADPAARATDVGPALLATSGQVAGVDPAAAAWLRSRALAMLARMGSAAPTGTVAAAAGVLRDAAAPVDLRVRAAAATGACIAAPGDTDVNAAVAAIRDVAMAALDANRAELDRQARAAEIGGGGPARVPAAGPAGLGDDADAGTPHRFRREAWRLATLADALAPTTGEGGLARRAGANEGPTTELARALRQAAVRLDAQPDADSLAAAIEDLAAFAAAPGAAQPAAPAPSDATPPAAAPDAGGSPFGG